MVRFHGHSVPAGASRSRRRVSRRSISRCHGLQKGSSHQHLHQVLPVVRASPQVAAHRHLLRSPGRIGSCTFCRDAVFQDPFRILQQHCLLGPRPHGDPDPGTGPAASRGHSQHRKIRRAVPHRKSREAGFSRSALRNDDPHKKIPVVRKRRELLYGKDPSLIKFHGSSQGSEHRQHIRETEAPPDTSPDCRKVPELHADNAFHRVPHRPAAVRIQGGVRLQLTKRRHAPDPEGLIVLFDPVQPQPGKIDGCAATAAAHLQPQHSADHPVCFFLIQFPGLLKGFRPSEASDLQHILSSCQTPGHPGSANRSRAPYYTVTASL